MGIFSISVYLVQCCFGKMSFTLIRPKKVNKYRNTLNNSVDILIAKNEIFTETKLLENP